MGLRYLPGMPGSVAGSVWGIPVLTNGRPASVGLAVGCGMFYD